MCSNDRSKKSDKARALICRLILVFSNLHGNYKKRHMNQRKYCLRGKVGSLSETG